MKTIEYQADKLLADKTDEQNSGIAKKLVLRSLEKLEVGFLLVEDGGQVYEFGNPSDRNILSAKITVTHAGVYKKVLFGGTIGVGEAYISGWWKTSDLVNVVRIFVSNQAQLKNMDNPISRLGKKVMSFMEQVRPNTLKSAKNKIYAHYDLSNEFFELFLDPTMMYSSAIYSKPAMSLEEASEYKLEHICRQLKLNETDHLLEIGTGWGGMAIHAAKNFGCKVTTTTISQQQYEYAIQRVKDENLEDRIEVLNRDYRLLDGKYDKLVSIEMIEAVGYQFYKNYFAKCSSLLKDDGLLLIQAITTHDQNFEARKKEIDFIRKYIFPGGCLPSHAVILDNIKEYTDLGLVSLQDITQDYAKTLSEWRIRFMNNLDSVRRFEFSEQFIRLWEFYLSYCEGGFAERAINTSQLLFAKPKYNIQYGY